MAMFLFVCLFFVDRTELAFQICEGLVQNLLGFSGIPCQILTDIRGDLWLVLTYFIMCAKKGTSNIQCCISKVIFIKNIKQI